MVIPAVIAAAGSASFARLRETDSRRVDPGRRDDRQLARRRGDVEAIDLT
ncbi:hypothetical protein [Novosphingobium sp. Gsoil 351]|nr:hypothetical protein [Novosphingobium sp. Gsoil 351]